MINLYNFGLFCLNHLAFYLYAMTFFFKYVLLLTETLTVL